MANPKTIYKANGTEIAFVDTSKEVKKSIEKLSKEALGASAKVIRKKLREDLPVYTKRFKNHIASWKFIDRDTGQPTLHIGFYSWQKVKKRGKLPSHASPWWVEFGTNPHIIRPKNAKIMWYQESFGFRLSRKSPRTSGKAFVKRYYTKQYNRNTSGTRGVPRRN